MTSFKVIDKEILPYALTSNVNLVCTKYSWLSIWNRWINKVQSTYDKVSFLQKWLTHGPLEALKGILYTVKSLI